MNKRGQDLSIGTLILIILGIAVLVILIIGFTSGWDFLISKFSIAPGQALESVAQSCLISGNNNLALDFCSFKEVKIDGKNQWLNCEDPRIEAANGNDYDNAKKPVCSALTGEGLKYTPNTFCEGRDDTDFVNNKECSGHATTGGSGSQTPPTQNPSGAAGEPIPPA
jgi:hypothetical protein